MPQLDDYSYTLPDHDRTCTECGETADDVLRFWESNAAGAAAVVDPEEVLCLPCLSNSLDGSSHPLSRLRNHEEVTDINYNSERNVLTIRTDGRAFGQFDHIFHIENDSIVVPSKSGRSVQASIKTVPKIVRTEMVDADTDVPTIGFDISPYREEAEAYLARLTRGNRR